MHLLKQVSEKLIKQGSEWNDLLLKGCSRILWCFALFKGMVRHPLCEGQNVLCTRSDSSHLEMCSLVSLTQKTSVHIPPGSVSDSGPSAAAQYINAPPCKPEGKAERKAWVWMLPDPLPCGQKGQNSWLHISGLWEERLGNIFLTVSGG